jgi:uncharacterized protein
MLFDMRPKTNREDLFGRDAELDGLKSALQYSAPLVILLGQRRVGKTSLLKTALDELDSPWIYLDMRRLDEEGYSKVVFYRILSDEITRLNEGWKRLGEALKKVRGIQIAGSGIELDWSEKGPLLSSLFQSLDHWAASQTRKREMRKKDVSSGKNGGNFLIIAIDEAQLLNNMLGGKGKVDFRSLIAYCYDNLPHIKFLLTGSEVGLLMDFLSLEDPKSALFGRGIDEITLHRFTREKSIEYLEAGFTEYNVKLRPETIQIAVDKLDGVVGWLTLFGNSAVQSKKRRNQDEDEILGSVVDLAKNTVRGELKSILVRSRYYGLALKSLASGRRHWRDIKSDLSSWIRRPVTDAQVTRTLSSLVKLDLVEKQNGDYVINDPVVSQFAKDI